MPSESLQSRANQRSFSLDAWRVLAILMVYAFHFPRAELDLGRLARYGWMGVDLFFVLSGFLIGGQILRRRNSFYTRRFLRTLPVYLVVLAAYFCFPWFREKPDLPPLWKFLTFTQNFGLTSSAFSHAWSLCIEEQFYLAAPPLIWLLMGRPRLAISTVILLLAGGLFYRHTMWLNANSAAPRNWDLILSSIYYPTWGRLDGLILGVALSAVRKPPPKWMTLTFGLALFALACWLFSDRLAWSANVFGYPTLALSFTLLIASTIGLHPPFKVPAVSQLAILSYSFYLIHKPIIHMLSAHMSGAELFVGAFAASLIAAFAMYEMIERPFLKLRDRWTAST